MAMSTSPILDLSRYPLPIGLTEAGFFSLPFIALLWVSANYYEEFLKAQSTDFYNSNLVEEYDFIVVGGGSSGAAVAARLSEKYKTLLVELGGDPHPVSAVPLPSWMLQRCIGTDLMYETVRQNDSCLSLNDQVMFWPRGTGLGGSSNLNNQIYQRGNPKDYDNWANITGNDAWAYKNVLKYFKKLEDYNGVYPNPEYHGRGGPIKVEKLRQTYLADYFLKAGLEKGYRIQDPNAMQTDGFGEIELTGHEGLRWGTYKGYIEPALSRSNLKIYRFARVTKVHLNKENHAHGITYNRFGMQKFVRAKKEIILSAGSLDTPKILMLSGIGPKDHLESLGIKCKLDIPVGKNLQDHLYTLFGPFLVDARESLLVNKDSDLNALNNFTKRGEGPFGSINGISALGYITTSASAEKSWPDIQFFMSGLGTSRALESTIFSRLFNIREDVLETYLRRYDGLDANFVITVLVRPKSRGEVRLASADSLDKPIIEPNYFKEEADIKAVVEGMKFLVDLYENTTTYKAINARLAPNLLPGCEHLYPKSDAYYECFARHFTMTLYHPVGTASMAANSSDSHGVVDSELRVLNTTGLRVIDASIMPVIVNANTNIPSIMIGEIGASFILNQYRPQKKVCSILDQIRKPVKKECISIFRQES